MGKGAPAPGRIHDVSQSAASVDGLNPRPQSTTNVTVTVCVKPEAVTLIGTE